MCDGGELLDVAERRTILALQPELDRHARLTEQAFNLIGMVLSSLPERTVAGLSLSERVATLLLIRISNDLRAAALLALRGYPVQSLCLVSSMYEAAYTVASIGSDENVAQQWIDHSDPTRPFRDVRGLTRSGLAKLGVPDPDTQAASEYRVYRQLCLAKHLNPLLQKQHGIQLQGNYVVAMNGPDISEPAVRGAWFALEHAAGLAWVGLTSFVLNHVGIEIRADLMRQVKAIGEARKQLEEAAKARWGIEDPFPGQWGI